MNSGALSKLMSANMRVFKQESSVNCESEVRIA